MKILCLISALALLLFSGCAKLEPPKDKPYVEAEATIGFQPLPDWFRQAQLSIGDKCDQMLKSQDQFRRDTETRLGTIEAAITVQNTGAFSGGAWAVLVAFALLLLWLLWCIRAIAGGVKALPDTASARVCDSVEDSLGPLRKPLGWLLALMGVKA